MIEKDILAVDIWRFIRNILKGRNAVPTTANHSSDESNVGNDDDLRRATGLKYTKIRQDTIRSLNEQYGEGRWSPCLHMDYYISTWDAMTADQQDFYIKCLN